MTINVNRSWLMVPTDQPDAISQACDSTASVILLDLFEGVAQSRRTFARESLKAAIGQCVTKKKTVYVQISPDQWESDVRACVCQEVSALVVARAETVEHIQALDALLLKEENRLSLPAHSIQMVLCLETARGHQDAYALGASSKRVFALSLGRVDLVMDLRPEPSGEIHLLPFLMQRLIILSRTLGLMAVGAWWRAPDRGLNATADNTFKAARRGRAVGFSAVMCVNPQQVEPIHRAYSQEAI
jgi:citrate lyase beta subunit